MNYFYATRRTKEGKKLVTSYEKQAQATKYGGPTATVKKDIYYLDDGRPTQEPGEWHEILRSKLEADTPSDANLNQEGRFVLYRQEGDRFVPTNFRFATYGNANNGMKSLVASYGTLIVVELQDPADYAPDDEDREMAEMETPF